MDTRHEISDTAPTGCTGWIGRAMQDLRRTMGEEPDQPALCMSAQAQTLLEHLRAGALVSALDICLDRPAGLARLHVDLFLPILQRLEADWTTDTIDYETLNFTFFHLHRLMALLGLHRRTRRPAGHFGRILVAMAPGEQHAFGAHVLADVLCDAGWSVDLHEDSRTEGLCTVVAATGYQALCLSVGHDAALQGLADTIAAVRAHAANPRMKVIVGGAGLEQPAGQYHFLGADHVVLSAAEGLDHIHLLRPLGAGRERT